MQETTDQKHPAGKYRLRYRLVEVRISYARDEDHMRYQEKFVGNRAYCSNAHDGRYRERSKACGAIFHPTVREIELLWQTFEDFQLLYFLQVSKHVTNPDVTLEIACIHNKMNRVRAAAR